jgi:Flp pilus assembly pilin Flp
MTNLFRKLWSQEEAQDIAEYAVMLAVILVMVVGTATSRSNGDVPLIEASAIAPGAQPDPAAVVEEAMAVCRAFGSHR